MLESKYEPMNKTKKEFLKVYNDSYKKINESKKIRPMTLEGCIVRISDIIAYIGRDIEDAINLGTFKRESLPKNITDVLGDNNKEIVNTIILDIINNSMNKPYIKMSDKVYEALSNLKKFNYKEIYSKSLTKDEYNYYKTGMKKIYNVYLDEVDKNNKKSIIFKTFLNYQSDEYNINTNNKRKVIDFISGMTDKMFLREIKKYMK